MKPLGRPSKNARVLLIEDDKDIVKVITRFLETSRFQVSVAMSMDEAVKVFLTESPDVVLLDLGLPDSWGVRTFERASRYAAGAPIVIVTGLLPGGLGAAYIRDGAQDVLHKPADIHPDRVVNALEYAILRSQKHVTCEVKGSKVWTLREARPTAFTLLVIVLLTSALLAVPIALAEEDAVSWAVLKESYEARVSQAEKFLDIVKWGAGAACGALVGALGLLYRALNQAHVDRVNHMKEQAEIREKQTERMSVALTEATAAMSQMAAKVGDLAHKISHKLGGPPS